MAEPRVFIVTLRQPRKIADPRSDPFWEFGSFGCTTCHCDNLLNAEKLRECPERKAELEMGRFAFVQGGSDGTKLVFLTPTVRIDPLGKDLCEAKWLPEGQEVPLRLGELPPVFRPFKYEQALLLIDNNGRSDFKWVKACIGNPRKSWIAQFASCFRGRCRPLDSVESVELIEVYEAHLQKAKLDQGRYFAIEHNETITASQRLCEKSFESRKNEYNAKVKEASKTVGSLGSKSASDPPAKTPPRRCGR